MNIEQQLVEWYLAGEGEVLGNTLPGVTLSTTNPYDVTWDLTQAVAGESQ
jgi:hypothetical protein